MERNRLLIVSVLVILVALLGPNVRAQKPGEIHSDRDQGIKLFTQGDPAKAIPPLRTAVKNDKHDVLAWYYLGLSFERVGRTEEAIPAFEGATKINPEDYFTSIDHPDIALFEARFLEVKPQLVAAANSVVHYLQLNKTLSNSKTKEWDERLAELYDYAALTTASDKCEPAKVTVHQFRKLPQSIVSRRLSGKLTFVIVLGASGKMRGVFPFGFVPRDLKDFYNREIQLTEFRPGAKDGHPVSQFASVSHDLNQLSGR